MATTTAQTLELVEKALLRGRWDDSIPSSLSSSSITPSTAIALCKKAVQGQFRDVLTSKSVHDVFRLRPSSADGGADVDVEKPFAEIFDFGISPTEGKDEEEQIEEELSRLAIAVACLHAFVQANWTGPELDITPLEMLSSPTPTPTTPNPWTAESIHAKSISELATHGEPAYHLSTSPFFLRIAQILVHLPNKHLKSTVWWRLRVENVHQQILDEPVLVEVDYAGVLGVLAEEGGWVREPDLKGRMYLELGLLDHLLARDKSAAEFFVKAARATGLEYELTGALGRRTKFQVNELSQLVLLAESRLVVSGDDDVKKEEKEASTPMTAEKETSPSLPETLALNDDTLLEQTQFTSSHPSSSHLSHIDPSAQPPLHPLDQCILLSLCLNVRNTSPAHGLTTEQMAPYVARVIMHPRNWSVHTMALLLRARLEASRTRTVERATLQLQALIDQMPTADSGNTERLLYFHAFALPSRWEMERELAGRYLSLGVVKSALEIFERLEMWEEVVKCYGALERADKGVAIIRDLLEGRKREAEEVMQGGKVISGKGREGRDKMREAKLWCLLGDLDPSHAVEHYTLAWDLSSHTSGRAMRSLGGFYFARALYPQAMASLKKAVKINPLLTRSWFILGCAAMRVEEWEEAREAFGRCVAIDEEDGESWNNLASMYLRSGGVGSGGAKVIKEEGEDATQDTPTPSSDGIPFTSKLLAFRALKQGLRYAYENWRMWYNYMIVAMDVGELQEACRALGRIVDQTGGKLGGGGGGGGVDEDVLDRLVDAVTRADTDTGVEKDAGAAVQGVPEMQIQNPNEGLGLYKNVRTLFDRTLLPRLSTPRIFRAYARLLSWRGEWEGAIGAYMDAYRCGSAASFGDHNASAGAGVDSADGGETQAQEQTETERWREAVREVEEIVDVLRNFGPRVVVVEGGKEYKWKMQARSVVRTFMGRTREFEDEPEWGVLEGILGELKRE